jgi:ferredoxin
MPSQWEIAVDGDRCIGSGLCVGVAPPYFVMSDNRKSRPQAAVVDPDGSLLDAALMCPTGAITITETGSGRHVVADDEA